MADYGAFPLWAVPDEMPLSQLGHWTAERPSDDLSSSTADSWAGGLAPDDLPLSASLIAALHGWVGEHDRLLGSTFEWPSEEAKAAFVADGRLLLDRVREELGSDYEVMYFDEITGRVEDE